MRLGLRVRLRVRVRVRVRVRLTVGRELDTVAVRGVRVQRACRLRGAWLEHLFVAEDLDSATARREEELLAAVIPRHLVDLEGELDVLERLRPGEG